MSKCTNPCYMTHCVLKARMNYCINQNPGQKITFKPNTKAPQCHWLPATRFERVQNPDLNKLHNVSKSCSRQNTSTQIMHKMKHGECRNMQPKPQGNTSCHLTAVVWFAEVSTLSFFWFLGKKIVPQLFYPQHSKRQLDHLRRTTP